MPRLILLTILLTLLNPSTQTPPFSTLQGFGTQSAPKILQTLPAFSDQSLRSSIQSHTHILLKPNITITLQSVVWIKQITDLIIQGPGTIVGFGLYVKNCTNVVLYNLRILEAAVYGVLVYGARNVVMVGLTVLDASRTTVEEGKCIDVTEDSANVTLSHSILGYTNFSSTDKYKGMLIANFLHAPVTNLSLHHNIFYQNYQRSPQISTPGLFDFKNNIIYGYTQYGSRIREGAYGNFIGNYYIGGKKDPMVFVDDCGRVCYGRGNLWRRGYGDWEGIGDLGDKEYGVPEVTMDGYDQLMGSIRKWGCQPETLMEIKIKSAILSYKSEDQVQ